mmetsp:Transcript_12519/g.30230  ORF Transcript_12519/g.30230 Transcript_12519/m.30230 type:complete len:302 (-) Transcript_12519:98-1003(-)|eukprot:CAMPEP_0113469736 /NCGR_PEP_ID=MMETSP0014_2-20120614/16059_1 /TAXON_ID=2857 /ORGANISM="Nitzschia sp." /LENGTH=301 /DNA_ID=CAMNT_0000362235 /DNA_START=319 /DNA_END=1224 /DNA_ORIENTATION=- /assembly_acc=CAM_ASM_000159
MGFFADRRCSSFLLPAFAAIVLSVTLSDAFQVQHLHHHPAYIKHAYGEQLHRAEHQQHHIRHDTNLAEGTVDVIECCSSTSSEQTSSSTSQPSSPPPSRVVISLTSDDERSSSDVSISTPISYDEETGMVQTAVRAIVEHPSISLIDNNMVGLSSTLVITVGALHEIVDCLEIEWTHVHHVAAAAAAGGGGAAGSMPTEGLAILSLGHFLHYGRETLKQLVEMHQQQGQQEEEEEEEHDGGGGGGKSSLSGDDRPQALVDPAIAMATTTAPILETEPVDAATKLPRVLSSRVVPLLSKLRP